MSTLPFVVGMLVGLAFPLAGLALAALLRRRRKRARDAAWVDYLAIRRQIRAAAEADKPGLVSRAMEIAMRWDFDPRREVGQ